MTTVEGGPTNATAENGVPHGVRGERDVDDDPRVHTAILWTFAAFMVVALWIRPITSSLWLDETGTWWVINGSAREVVQRAEAVQGQSPFYYLILWLSKGVIGHSEIALRLPSLVFSIAAVVFVYLLARRLIDSECARIAVVAFIVWPQVAFEASDARPYALAAMLSVACAVVLVAWLDVGGLWRGVGTVLLAASIPYAHPVSALVLIPLGLYAIVRVVEGSTPVRTPTLVIAAFGIIVLLIPVVRELSALANRSNDWNVPSALSGWWVVATLLPASFAAAGLTALILTIRKRARFVLPRSPTSTQVLLGSWFLIPSATLFGLSFLTPVQLLGTRYYMMIAPAAAIIAGALIRSVEPPRARRIVIMVLVLVSVVDVVSRYKSGDVRAAIALAGSVADDHTTTFISYGFIESNQPMFFSDPKRQGLLTAPTSYYPLPGDVVALPADLTQQSAPFARAEIERAIASGDRILVISVTGSPYGPWLDEVFRGQGYTSRTLGSVELLTVTEFTPDPS